MKMVRTIRGILLRGRIRNKDTPRDVEVRDVVRLTRKRRRMWRDHFYRIKPERITEGQKPNTKRSSGRPPKRWYKM